MTAPAFQPGDLESLNRLYLELSLVCVGARTWRDIENEREISRLNSRLAEYRAVINRQSHELAELERQRHEAELAAR